jgi:hypothetical protein
VAASVSNFAAPWSSPTGLSFVGGSACECSSVDWSGCGYQIRLLVTSCRGAKESAWSLLDLMRGFEIFFVASTKFFFDERCQRRISEFYEELIVGIEEGCFDGCERLTDGHRPSPILWLDIATRRIAIKMHSSQSRDDEFGQARFASAAHLIIDKRSRYAAVVGIVNKRFFNLHRRRQDTHTKLATSDGGTQRKPANKSRDEAGGRFAFI